MKKTIVKSLQPAIKIFSEMIINTEIKDQKLLEMIINTEIKDQKLLAYDFISELWTGMSEAILLEAVRQNRSKREKDETKKREPHTED